MPGKRLIVACDGTWANIDSGIQYKPGDESPRLAIPTNVTRICRAILPHDDATDKEQIVYYQAGLGSSQSNYSYYIGGYLGEGITENIREAYSFICNNYEDGDEIFLIGFSRGAFTARSIGSLIASIGLLTRAALQDFYPIFLDWENQYKPDFKNPYLHRLGFDKPVPFRNKAYFEKLDKLTRWVTIKAIAVYDTVGTLGMPEITWLKWLPGGKAARQLSFVNTEVSANVEHAYQALALDESRSPFGPTVWESPRDPKDLPPLGPNDWPRWESNLKELKQCWFPGVHTDIGGGYPDTNNADIVLAWTMSQLSNLVKFDTKYITLQQSLNIKWYNDKTVNPNGVVRPWSLGLVKNNIGFTDNWLTGQTTRTPGEYCQVDPSTGYATSTRLQNTKEFIHPCVRVREESAVPAGIAGLGVGDAKGPYRPAALKNFKLYYPNQAWDKSNGYSKPWGKEFDGDYKWVIEHSKSAPTFIVEDRIGDKGIDGDKDDFETVLFSDDPKEKAILEQRVPPAKL